MPDQTLRDPDAKRDADLARMRAALREIEDIVSDILDEQHWLVQSGTDKKILQIAGDALRENNANDD